MTDPTLADMFQVLGLMAIPAAILLTVRYFNRRGERTHNVALVRRCAGEPARPVHFGETIDSATAVSQLSESRRRTFSGLDIIDVIRAGGIKTVFGGRSELPGLGRGTSGRNKRSGNPDFGGSLLE